MTTTVTECLTGDHRRLDAIVPEVEGAAKAGRPDDAASAFARFDEGLDRLERYLNDAYMARLPWVRIIHGRGTGAMRSAVRDVLKSHPLVGSMRTGEAKLDACGGRVMIQLDPKSRKQTN